MLFNPFQRQDCAYSCPHLSNKFESSSIKFEGSSESDLSTFVKENL